MPARPPHTTPRPFISPPGPPQASTILIVDDQPVGREVLETLLLAQGYDLVFAADGQEALSQAAALKPDLILLDVMMPGMDGFEVCRRLRADPVLSEVPVVIVTALDDNTSRLKGIEAGADDFITKPFNRTELRARVRTITRLNRYRRLLAERVRFAWVVDQADDGYLLLSEADEVLYANPRARRLLGLAAHSLDLAPERFLTLARRHYQIEPQAAWASWPDLPPTTLSSSRYLLHPETGATQAFWLEVNLLDMHDGDERTRLVRLRDITHQVATHRDIRRFHHVIRHKLRTPVVSLLGGLGLLANHAGTMPGDEIIRYTEIAMRGASRLQGVLEDILRYIDRPQATLPEQGFALDGLPALVESLAATLDLAAPAMDIAPELQEARLTLTAEAVEIILGEVLENAKKFHPSHSPTIAITARQSGDGQITLTLADDGVHLSPEHLALVWDQYYQGEKHFTGEIKGMGLGLPLVAALVWEASGHCHMANRADGPGIVVQLILPFHQG